MLSQRSCCSARCHCFQLGTILCCAVNIIMYIPVWMAVYCDVVLCTGLPRFCANAAQRTTSRTGINKILNWHVGWHSRKQQISWRPDCENTTLKRQCKCNDSVNTPVQWSAFVVQLASYLLHIIVKSTSMVLYNFWNFAVCGNVHYIWHWMVLSVVLPNMDTSVKILSTSSTIIWSREIEVFVL